MDNNYYHRLSRTSNCCMDCGASRLLIMVQGESSYYEDDRLATIRRGSVSCKKK
jgi:hypothetical protein